MLHSKFATTGSINMGDFSTSEFNCGGFYLKFEPFSLKIRRCDFSLNEMRTRFARLFSFPSQSQKKWSRTARQEGFEGRNAVPSSALFFWGGRRGKSCGSIPPFEPQAFYHNRAVRSGPLPLQVSFVARSSSVRMAIPEPTSAVREQPLMKEAEVDRFSREFSGNQEPLWLNSTI